MLTYSGRSCVQRKPSPPSRGLFALWGAHPPPLSRCRASIKSQMQHHGLASVRDGVWDWRGPYAGLYAVLPTLIKTKR